jgi:hypothetical protein
MNIDHQGEPHRNSNLMVGARIAPSFAAQTGVGIILCTPILTLAVNVRVRPGHPKM